MMRRCSEEGGGGGFCLWIMGWMDGVGRGKHGGRWRGWRGMEGRYRHGHGHGDESPRIKERKGQSFGD